MELGRDHQEALRLDGANPNQWCVCVCRCSAPEGEEQWPICSKQQNCLWRPKCGNLIGRAACPPFAFAVASCRLCLSGRMRAGVI